MSLNEPFGQRIEDMLWQIEDSLRHPAESQILWSPRTGVFDRASRLDMLNVFDRASIHSVIYGWLLRHAHCPSIYSSPRNGIPSPWLSRQGPVIWFFNSLKLPVSLSSRWKILKIGVCGRFGLRSFCLDGIRLLSISSFLFSAPGKCEPHSQADHVWMACRFRL